MSNLSQDNYRHSSAVKLNLWLISSILLLMASCMPTPESDRYKQKAVSAALQNAQDCQNRKSLLAGKWTIFKSSYIPHHLPVGAQFNIQIEQNRVVDVTSDDLTIENHSNEISCLIGEEPQQYRPYIVLKVDWDGCAHSDVEVSLLHDDQREENQGGGLPRRPDDSIADQIKIHVLDDHLSEDPLGSCSDHKEKSHPESNRLRFRHLGTAHGSDG